MITFAPEGILRERACDPLFRFMVKAPSTFAVPSKDCPQIRRGLDNFFADSAAGMSVRSFHTGVNPAPEDVRTCPSAPAFVGAHIFHG